MTGERSITLRVGFDNDCKDTKLILQLECKTQKGHSLSLPPESRLEILVKDKMPVNFCTEPKVFQTVKFYHDDGSETMEDICYDFYSNTKEKYELLSDKILGIKNFYKNV